MTQIVSSISGIEIYAPSAGYAPTNSADVSAIASGYQVVSATSTELYAGTAFLTGVNGAPVSASRAGQAANASMSNSAYYDGTGRLISALPDSAAVSGIASAYAESAASGKLDSSASSAFYTTANESGYVGSAYVEGQVSSKQDASAMSAYQLTADMSGYYTTVNESGYVDSAYVDSAVSGKQDTLTFDWDADSAISAINGSALAGQGGGASVVVTGTAWDPDTSAYVYDLSSNLSGAERHVYSSQVDGQIDYIDKFFDDSANTYRLEAALIRAGAEQYAGGLSSKFVYMPRSSMWTTADAATGVFTPLRYATGACLAMSATNDFKAYYKGNEWFVADTRYGMLRGEIHQSRGLRIVASGANSASGFQLHPSGVDGVGTNGSAWRYGANEYTSLTSVASAVSSNSADWNSAYSLISGVTALLDAI